MPQLRVKSKLRSSPKAPEKLRPSSVNVTLSVKGLPPCNFAQRKGGLAQDGGRLPEPRAVRAKGRRRERQGAARGSLPYARYPGCGAGRSLLSCFRPLSWEVTDFFQTTGTREICKFSPQEMSSKGLNATQCQCVRKTFLLCEPVPCKPAAQSALHPLIWRSKTLSFHVPSSLEIVSLSQTPVMTTDIMHTCYHTCVCTCACVHVNARVSVRVRACLLCVCVCVCTCASVYMLYTCLHANLSTSTATCLLCL